MSEPPEAEETNMKTGLRGGFPIKINGQALGSQDNLQEFGQSMDIFGPRIRSRQSSVTPQEQENELQQGRRRSLRGTTPVKIAGMEFTTNSGKEELLFSTPFGTTQAGAGQIKKGGIMGKRSLPQYQNNNSISTQNKSSSLLNLSLLQDAQTKIETTPSIFKSEENKTEEQLLNQSYTSKEDNKTITSDLKQEKEEHLQKTITIRVSHRVTEEKETSEIRNVNNNSFSNQTNVESFDGYSTDLATQETISTSEVVQQSQEINSSESISSTFEVISQQKDIMHNQNISSNVEFTLSENGHEQVVQSMLLDSPNLNLRSERKEASPSSPFILQRPKAFQKSNNQKAANVFPKMSCGQKDTINGELEGYQNMALETNDSVFKESRFTEKREFTPLDLPMLSRLPEKNVENKETTSDAQDKVEQDLQKVEFLGIQDETQEIYSSMCSVEEKRKSEYNEIQSMIFPKEEQEEKLNNHLKENVTEIKDADITSKCNPETQIRPDIGEVESKALTDNLELDMEEVKEYNVQAKIIIGSNISSDVTDSHRLHDRDFNCNNLESKCETSAFRNELHDLGIIQTVDKNVETRKTEDSLKSKEDKLIKELNEKFHDGYKTTEEEINAEMEENKNDSIADHHKDMINKCIQELEASETYQLDEEFLTINKSQESNEESHFTTEKIIDNTDLEHLYVMNKKNDERRDSSSLQGIDTRNYAELRDISISKTKNSSSSQLGEEEVTKTGMQKLSSMIAENKSFIESESSITTCNSSIVYTESEKESDTETETIETFKDLDGERTSTSDSNTFFLTESNSENDSSYSWQFKLDLPKITEKRKRNRTIDYHNLPSLFWEGAVKDYHEKTFPESQSEENDIKADEKTEDKNGFDIAKDGLSIILERLKGIESKLDSLKETETTITSRHDARRSSLPGRFSTLSNLPGDILPLEDNNDAPTPTQEPDINPGDNEGSEANNDESEANHDNSSSNCSTPTFMEIKPKPKVNGYESDSTVYQESDCEIIIDEKSENDEAREDTWTYKPFNLNISEISDLDSEEEDPEERSRRIESLAAMMTLQDNKPTEFRREQLNMEIDTLSERSEEEGEREEQKPRQRSRRPSGRKRSMSRDRNVAKLRYCWRCHHAGHENWECREDVQPGGWCPRCLETSHWEDACWVEAAHVLCTICSIPGHLPCIHQATDFRQRKLVIDTFGWLPFKDWFQDLTFRSWWNCSGYTGVPLYKIMQRNPSQDLDLGFEDS